MAVAIAPRRLLALKLRPHQSPLVTRLGSYHERLAVHPRAHRDRFACAEPRELRKCELSTRTQTGRVASGARCDACMVRLHIEPTAVLLDAVTYGGPIGINGDVGGAAEAALTDEGACLLG